MRMSGFSASGYTFETEALTRLSCLAAVVVTFKKKKKIIVMLKEGFAVRINWFVRH